MTSRKKRQLTGVFDVSVNVWGGVGELEGVVDLLVAQLVSHAGEDVHQLGVGDEALALTVEGLEGLVEVVKGARVFLILHLGVDGEELLQLVALLTWMTSWVDSVGGDQVEIVSRDTINCPNIFLNIYYRRKCAVAFIMKPF